MVCERIVDGESDDSNFLLPNPSSHYIRIQLHLTVRIISHLAACSLAISLKRLATTPAFQGS